MKISFVIPGQPVAKGRHRSFIGKRKDGKAFIANYTPKETVNYEALVRLAASEARGSAIILSDATVFRGAFYFQIPDSRAKKLSDGDRHCQRPDTDNLTKAVADALNKVIWTDDSLVSDMVILKRWGSEARAEIEVTQADELTHCPYCRKEL